MTSTPFIGERILHPRRLAFSLPGMVREEKITRSPGSRSTLGCSPAAMRAMAARVSPWLPVQSATTLRGCDALELGLLRGSEVGVEIARLLRRLDDAVHGAADDDELAARGAGGIGDRAHARDVGGESGHGDAAAAPRGSIARG